MTLYNFKIIFLLFGDMYFNICYEILSSPGADYRWYDFNGTGVLAGSARVMRGEWLYGKVSVFHCWRTVDVVSDWLNSSAMGATKVGAPRHKNRQEVHQGLWSYGIDGPGYGRHASHQCSPAVSFKTAGVYAVGRICWSKCLQSGFLGLGMDLYERNKTSSHWSPSYVILESCSMARWLVVSETSHH